MLKKYNKVDSNPMKTLIHTSTLLNKDENDKKVDYIIYWGMIDSILYFNHTWGYT